MRIVEIGDKPFVQHAFPGDVHYFSTAGTSAGPDGGGQTGLLSLWRALRDPGLSLVVCHPTFYPPWHWQALSRALFDRRLFRRPFAPTRALGPQLLRTPLTVPLAIVDHEDLPRIDRGNLFLLRRSTLYFKRELPPDRWRLFMGTAHPNLPTPRFRRSSRLRQHIDKIRPLSLGLPLGTPDPFPLEPQNKTVDIFFAGQVEDLSTVRVRGLAELRALAGLDVTVDIPDGRLPRLEFLQRCARAMLVWSPEGLGWDCFRHYEAAACGSVPLINNPTIERHAPLLEGRHAVHYDVEPGGLTSAVMSALQDRQRLILCGREARDHVLQHHTPAQLARHIVETTLEAARPRAGDR